MFTVQNIAAMILCGLLSAVIPITAAIIYKSRNKSVPLSAFFTGAGVFILFAMGLEQLCHMVMVPIVSGNDMLYVLYGTLAAGVFEETGRFAAFRTVLRKHSDPRTAILYGIGHGGCEAILLVGMSAVSGIVIALSVNSMGLDDFVTTASGGQTELADTVRAQIEAYAAINFGTALLSVFERTLAMIFHTAISVLVFEGTREKGKFWLFPVCILLHALLDVPAALFQRGAFQSMTVLYALTALITAAVVYCAVRSYRRMQKQ